MGKKGKKSLTGVDLNRMAVFRSKQDSDGFSEAQLEVIEELRAKAKPVKADPRRAL